ncbi:MAG: methyltransferase domain-containing protein [Candidatus Omnitrophica bacterium]|nr:methyltransferase domain-containing protein [Candidatus Omnitrophota bacterium]
MSNNDSTGLLANIIKLTTKGLKSGAHITRYYMYQHLESVLKGVGNANLTNQVLSISRSLYLCNLLPLKNPIIVEANYPQYNILALQFDDNIFDYVVCEQVLEHVEGSPQQAVDEIYRVLKPGGIAVLTTCFINPIHGGLGDYWRFTPNALQLLFKKYSKVIDVDGWGNPHAWFIAWLGLRFYPIPHASWHPLHKLAIKNHKDWPIVTWIVAQK